MTATAVAAVTGITLAGCGNNGEEESESIQLRLAYEAPEGGAQTFAADIFSDTVEEASNGQITVQQYPGGQLGNESDTLDSVRAGDIDIAITSVANASGIMPESAVLSLHYLASSSDEAVELFSSEEVNDEYRRIAEENLSGIEPLSLFMLPIRHMYGSEAISEPADTEDNTIRVQAAESEHILFSAYGAQTVDIPMPELYSGLQTGLVDMAEGAVTTYLENNHHEVAPVVSLTYHELNGQVLWISTEALESLRDEQVDAVRAAALEVTREQPSMAIGLEEETFADLEERGVTIHEDVDVTAFQEIAEPYQQELAGEISDDAVSFLEVIRQSVGD
ncbi:TRAP transporter substrate-binding protein [Nesterenkonia ebinurensis]|uniref:TRAP transporter substrate-binding protein n=1 Tax=Nesterenkonia ebinurensis TaxID=2608252 RepID=UPI00168B2B76|nr:TRAP transporter substrate-binding protein [Nesterenkonia ebinurensis]